MYKPALPLLTKTRFNHAWQLDHKWTNRTYVPCHESMCPQYAVSPSAVMALVSTSSLLHGLMYTKRLCKCCTSELLK